MSKRRWNIKYFRKAHSSLDEQIRRYRLTNRGRNALSDEVKQHMDEPMSLNATNLTVRMALADCLKQDLEDFFPAGEAPRAFFVTLTHMWHAVPLDRAAEFDVSNVSRWVSGMLDRFDWFGALDLAFYPRGIDGTPTMAWHAHAMVRGVSRADISDVGRNDYDAKAYLPGAKWFHFGPVSRERLLERALYTVKAPTREYYVYPNMEEYADRTTGEMLRRPTGEYQQKKRPIRSGQYAKVARILSKQTIDGLLLGGGYGAAFRRKLLMDLGDHLDRLNTERLYDIRKRLGLPPIHHDT